jgi:predicted membrane GTPase involved in stress response
MELARRQEPEEEDEENIMELILKLMKQAEDFMDKNGVQKKEMVMNNLKHILGISIYTKNYQMINQTIDFIVSIARGNTKIDFKTLKKRFYNCC